MQSDLEDIIMTEMLVTLMIDVGDGQKTSEKNVSSIDSISNLSPAFLNITKMLTTPLHR